MEGACTLAPIACADDSGCGPGGTLSSVCVEGLEMGETYYILVGGKSYETQGEYRLTVSSTTCADVGRNPSGVMTTALPALEARWSQLLAQLTHALERLHGLRRRNAEQEHAGRAAMREQLELEPSAFRTVWHTRQ